MNRGNPKAGMRLEFVRAVGQGLLDLVYPRICLFCEVLLADGEWQLCEHCHQELTADAAHTCPRCAGTVGPYAETSAGCSHCREDAFAFQGVWRLGAYEGKLRDAVLRIKQEPHEPLADHLGELLAQRIRSQLLDTRPEAVIPIPLHWLKRWQRGYNQAAALAEGLARRARLPLRTGWLWRRRATPAQTTLSPTERRTNLRGAFAARVPAELQGKPLLLVDDVVTTGSTASAAARALRQAGAGPIWVAVTAKSVS